MAEKKKNKEEIPLAVVGRVAQSKAGRDAGKFFMVTAVVDAEYVLLADGRYRKLNKAKKKKCKHIAFLPVVLDGIAEKIKTGTKVFDSEVSRALRELGETELPKEETKKKEPKAKPAAAEKKEPAKKPAAKKIKTEEPKTKKK